MSNDALSRRHFLIRAACVAALPLAALAPQWVAAQVLKPLPVDNPQAKALGYSPDAATVKHANFKAGSSCSNCQFFTAATGACALFVGFSVSPKGWCTAWAKKA